jgi:hypothetical protein
LSSLLKFLMVLIFLLEYHDVGSELQKLDTRRLNVSNQGAASAEPAEQDHDSAVSAEPAEEPRYEERGAPAHSLRRRPWSASDLRGRGYRCSNGPPGPSPSWPGPTRPGTIQARSTSVPGHVGPPVRGGGPGTALMPLVLCWPGPRHCKARRPIKPIGPDCAPTTGGADPSSAAMRLPAACGRRGGRGSSRPWGRRRRPARGLAVAEPRRRRRSAWPGPGPGGGGEAAGLAPGSGGRRGGRAAWPWRRRRRPARRQAVAEELAARAARSQPATPMREKKWDWN